MQKEILYLQPSCYFVKGYTRGIICDTQRQNFDLVPISLIDFFLENNCTITKDIINVHDPEVADIINEYIEFMIEKEYVFCSDLPYDSFRKIEEQFDIPFFFSNAILDYKFGYSKYNLTEVITQLSGCFCPAIQVRFFGETDKNFIRHEFLKSFEKTTIRCVEIILEFNKLLKDSFLKELIENCGRLFKIIVYSSEQDHIYNYENAEIVYTSKELSSNKDCGYVSPDNFVVNLDMFLESKKYNNCLNKKVSVDIDGQIKNCPAMPLSFGNVGKDLIGKNLFENEAFIELWHINKDLVDICKDCEFRYICHDCRAILRDPSNTLSKPKHCNYDPYSGSWEL